MRRLLYVGVTIVATVAILACFHSVLSAPNARALLMPGDATSGARDYWAMAQQHRSPFSFTRDRYLGAPEGQARSPSLQIANAAEPLFVVPVGRALGYLAAMNLFWALGLVASVVLMVALLARLDVHPLAAGVGAVAFTVSEWEYEQLLYGHVAFAHLWVFPALLLALLFATHGPIVRAALPGVLLAASFYVTSYFGLFALIAVAAYVLAVLRLEPPSRLGARAAVGGAAAAAAMAPALLASRIAPSGGLGLPPSASRASLAGSSLLDFLVPSSHNALYGHVLGLGSASHVGEHALFPGLAATALALLLLWKLRRGRACGPFERLAAIRTAALLLPLGVLLSLPAYATVGGRAIPLPDAAYVIGSFVQWWRIYTRVGVLVGFGVALLAAVCLDELIRRRTRTAAALALAAGAVACFESLPCLHVPTVQLSPTPVTRWLAAHPGGIVALYPMQPADGAMTRGNAAWDGHVFGSLFLQTLHGHPLYALPAIQMTPTREDAIRVLTSDLRRPSTARLLASEHVRYVVVDRAAYRSIGATPPLRPPGLVEVARLPDARVYRVAAPPASPAAALAQRHVELARAYVLGTPSVRFHDGFFGPEPYRLGTARWMSQDGAIVVQPQVARPWVTYRVSAVAFSASERRELIVTLDGKVVDRQLIQPFETSFSFETPPLRAAATFRLRVIPGPSRLGPKDPRVASIYVIEWFVQPFKARLDG